MLKWLFSKEQPLSIVPKATRGRGLRIAANKAAQVEGKTFSIQPPQILKGVVPAGQDAGVAMDNNLAGFSQFTFGLSGVGSHFLGYQYLSELATRPEYRAMASALATELTREWITLNSSETDDEKTKKKITELTAEIKRIGLQQVIQRAAEHDCFFGRAQLFIDIRNAKRHLPLILSPKTIAKGSFLGVKTVEAIWTTPATYNALDPAADDFYKPSQWFMLGQEVHASRLLTVITRPLPDMLKAAFNFGGISLSQLAEPYVNNWLRTRQSVSDLIANFSITVLKTDMTEVLTAGDSEEASDAASNNLFDRIKLFTATRSNKGIMVLDEAREDLGQVNTPLSGLHELQSQALEQLCFVSHEPAVVLTGLSPQGLNASTEGEMSSWQKWVAAQQEAYWREPIETVIKVLQLSMYGEIDDDISVAFNPLFQLTGKELAEIRTADANTAAAYIDRGVIDPSEERERIARDPESGYQGLDLSKEIGDPNEENEEATSGAVSSER